MAEATTTTRTITREEKVFTLTLTEEEFTWLRELVGDQPSDDGNGASGRVWDAVESPADGTYTHKGVTYDLSATYLDTSSDPWRFTGVTDGNGEPLFTCQISGNDGYENWPLSRLVAEYRTLKKI